MKAEVLSPQRGAFEIPEDVCYLNCAYMSPQLEAARIRGQAAAAAKAEPWTFTDEHWFGQVEEARARFATLIGARADDIAIVPSASYGISTAARNCELRSGQTVVLLEDQFPSGVYPWRRTVEGAGASIVTVSRPEDHDWTPAILEAVDERCAVVTVPQVHWTNGARIDLVQIGRQARNVGAKLVLDLSQSVGADPIDLGQVDPDWLCAPTYKWLLGPYSMGFVYVAPRNQFGTPLEENWIARAGSEDFTALVDYRDDYRPGARRYDMGERSNFVLLPMVLEGLAQIQAWGVERIAATLSVTTRRLAEIGERHGFEPVPEKLRGPHILGLDREGGLPRDLIPRLAEASVHIGRRGNALRVAPHLHVTEADLTRFDDALGRALG